MTSFPNFVFKTFYIVQLLATTEFVKYHLHLKEHSASRHSCNEFVICTCILFCTPTPPPEH